MKEIDSIKDINYFSTANPPGLYFTKEDDTQVHLSRISSGERSYIILLADLARRLQLNAPRLSLQEISAIVLIDEIELNLHPTWQSEIIPLLRRAFPACQFIVTTHSPQVLSALENHHVRALERGKYGYINVSTPINTKGRTSNYLLEGVMGAAERFPEVDEAIRDFNNAIDNHDIHRAEVLLNVIKSKVDGMPPELVVFNKRLTNLMSRVKVEK